MKIFFSLLFISIFLNATTLNIAVAANVSYAIKSLEKEFKVSHPNIKCNIILGSSGKLTAQITHGAPYHIFMSANMLYPETLYKQHLAITKPKVYAKGKLALISYKKRDDLSLALLNSDTIHKIAIANPKTAPYGVAAKELLLHLGIYKKLKPKFIYGESVSQTLSFAITAADVGIVAASALHSKKMQDYKEYQNWITLDTKNYQAISQGIVILKYAKNNPAAKAFYDFILSKKAEAIFTQYGYLSGE
jgi:molybdate transport system substrate-binding protein